MKILLIATTLLVACATLSAETVETIEESLTLAPGGKLQVEVGFGSIEVKAHDSDEVVVKAVRKVSLGGESAEKKFLAENPVTISEKEGTVSVISKAKSKSGWGWTGRRKTTAEYVVAVPSKCDTELKTSGGAIKITGLSGTTEARTSGGEMQFVGLIGSLDGRTSGGRIRVEDCEGELTVRTSGGSITLENGKGTFDGRTSGGRISLSDFDGPVDVKTSGGGIDIETSSGSVKASTSGGGIEAVIASGKLDPIDVNTSGGSITVRLPANAAYDVDAFTSGGRVTTEFSEPTQDKKKTNRLTGSVNGGGSPVKLRTSGGGVRIRTL